MLYRERNGQRSFDAAFESPFEAVWTLLRSPLRSRGYCGWVQGGDVCFRKVENAVEMRMKRSAQKSGAADQAIGGHTVNKCVANAVIKLIY